MKLKRILIFTISMFIALFIIMFSKEVMAATYIDRTTGFSYSYYSNGTEVVQATNTVSVKGYENENIEDLVIPDYIGGRKVVAIGNYAFKNYSLLSSVTIPDAVETIGNGAFSGCSVLENVSMHENIKTIGSNAFNNCAILEYIDLSHVDSIGDSAFYGCSSLNNIELSDNIKAINRDTFERCISLESINTKNVKTIGYSAFYGCNSLRSINFSSQLKTIQNYAFAYCNSLVAVAIPSSVVAIDESSFVRFTDEKLIILGASGSAAEDYANNNSEKVEFVVAKPVTKIGLSIPKKYLYIGETMQANMSILDDACGVSYTFESSDENVATIDRNGNIVGKKAGNTTIKATIESVDGSRISKSQTITIYKREIPFEDVVPTSWYYNAVKYVYENKIISGLNETEFGPNDKLTRGMMVTILYRMEKSPDVPSNAPTFTDVKDSKKWYYKAVRWAAAKKIVSGYNDGRFGPTDNITREQLAIILYKYANYKGKDVSKTDDLNAFSDANKVASYALKQVKWAVAEGVITGSNGKLNPKGNASRAEVAAMMEKYCKKVGK